MLTTMRKLGLCEVITERHDPGKLVAPRTYERGSRPIDGIFVSPSLEASRCGYLPFVLDHRCLWIDIPMEIAFGQESADKTPKQRRRLRNDDPRTRKKYLKIYKKFIEEHRLLERAQFLAEHCSTPPTEEDIEEYNAIDKLRVEGMRQAELKCRKLFLGGKEYCPELGALRHEIQLWMLMIKRRSGGKVNSRFLHRKAKRAKVTGYQRLSLDELREKKDDAFTRYWELAIKPDRRLSWLEGLCEARAKENNTDGESELRQRIQAERSRKEARLIAKVNGKIRSGAVTTVWAPDGQGGRAEMTNRSEMEQALLDESQRRFTQASDTPFMKDPLFSLVGKLGITAASKEILEGTFQCPEDVDQVTQWYIRQLVQDRAQFLPSYWELRNEILREGWKKSRENTAAGPSGLTFSHFIANAHDDLTSELDFLLTSIPYRTGLSPERWQHGTNCWLEKKKGNFNVEKLRTILLYEADFNMMNKFIGRQMMKSAEHFGDMAPEQFGSRNAKSAIDHCLNKCLVTDLMRQYRIAGALLSNDAKSCYDRILHATASLSMQRIGMPQEPIICMFSTIQNLTHTVRTVYGDST